MDRNVTCSWVYFAKVSDHTCNASKERRKGWIRLELLVNVIYFLPYDDYQTLSLYSLLFRVFSVVLSVTFCPTLSYYLLLILMLLLAYFIVSVIIMLVKLHYPTDRYDVRLNYDVAYCLV